MVKTIIPGQPHQEAEAEQQHQRRLLGWRTVTFMASRQTNDAIQNTRPPAGHAPVEVAAQREQADGQRDQPTVCPKSVPVSVRAEGRKDPYLCRNPVP